MRTHPRLLALAVVAGLLACSQARATLITDPNDPRSFQGATVGTFADLVYGSNTPANRQLVVDNQLLDDGIIDTTGYTTASLLPTAWANAQGGYGVSHDLTGTGSYAYSILGGPIFPAANAIDNQWIQSSGRIGDTVFDLGFQATKAAIFPVIDHGPLPQESIESTVYLSNDLVNWTLAVLERVWLNGFQTNTGILWDGFSFAVGTGTNQTFRYASIIHGGPSALFDDGDDEINGVMGLRGDFTPNPSVPEPATWATATMGLLAGLAYLRRRRNAG